jgi:hypothetical protein
VSEPLVAQILAAAGQPVAGNTLTLEQLRQAVIEKRVLTVCYASVEGDGEAWFGYVFELTYYSVTKILPPYIVFPKPIPRALRVGSFFGNWEEVADVYAEFGIDNYDATRVVKFWQE